MISGEIGLRKPDPRIYELGAEAIGLAPELCVFVDDLPGNLKPARELGMATVHHRDAEENRRSARGPARRLAVVQPAAISATPASAATIPSSWIRRTRSPSSTRASTIVVTG